MCTVCGTQLQAPPRRSTPNNTVGISPIPIVLHNQVRDASRELQQILSGIRGRIDTVGRDQVALLEELQGVREEWQTVPAAILNPQGSTTSSRPTAKATLDALTRISLEDQSDIFQKALIQYNNRTIEGLPGLWASDVATISIDDAKLVIAAPRTGKGGLGQESINSIQTASSQRPAIVYFDRGGDVTFVQKAILAQQAGAKAAIIGNNVAEPWPYLMKDSNGEAASLNLNIPVAMIKQSDAKALLSNENIVGISFKMQRQSKDCVVCTDNFEVGQVVVRLPDCGHIFHEECALQWLRSHNTCPYCRRLLPTDDEDFERERRRIQQTHAGSERLNNAWHNFYG